MRRRAIIDRASKPALPGYVRLHYDELRQRWALLAPEKVFWPDAVGLDILKRCTGEASTDEIVRALSADYAAPEAEIREDVITFLQDWADQRIVICR